MLDDLVGNLRCSTCGAGLTRLDSALRCDAGHWFEIARQGYVSLPPPGAPGGSGDTAAMVRARSEFLAGGHYAGIAGLLADAGAASLAVASPAPVPRQDGHGDGQGTPTPACWRPRSAGCPIPCRSRCRCG